MKAINGFALAALLLMQRHQVFTPLTLVQVHPILNIQSPLQLPELLLSIHSLNYNILFDLFFDLCAYWGLGLLRDLPVLRTLIKEHLLQLNTICVVVVHTASKTQVLDVQVLRLPL